MEEDDQSYTETETETTETEDEDELKSNRLDQLIYKVFCSNKRNVQVKYTLLTDMKWFLPFTWFVYIHIHTYTHTYIHTLFFLKRLFRTKIKTTYNSINSIEITTNKQRSN